VPLAETDVPPSGLELHLVADEKVRSAIAKLADVATLPQLEANFRIRRHGRNGLRVVGRVTAAVGQTCGVTLEPMQSEVDEAVDVVLIPDDSSASEEHAMREVEVLLDDDSEPLIGGVVDLGALATDFLILGIDPYPRKPGSNFELPQSSDETTRPFAALVALRQNRGDKRR
jgi:hypothetical protein